MDGHLGRDDEQETSQKQVKGEHPRDKHDQAAIKEKKPRKPRGEEVETLLITCIHSKESLVTAQHQ